jgi:hypothetical protein
MQALCLPGRLDGGNIAQTIRRPRLTNFYGLLSPQIKIARKNEPLSRTTPFLERLWLPGYAVLLHTKSRQAEKDVWTSVSGLSGHFTLLDCAEELTTAEIGDDYFPPALEEAQAAEIAKKGLMRFVIGQRGQINKPVVESVLQVRVYFYPYWVYYFRRLFGKFDIKVFDASTGKSAGPRVRAEVINAMVTASKGKSS